MIAAGEGNQQAGRRLPWVPARLFPFRSRFLDVAGCRVHYVDEGQGPPLLLLHGNPTWSFLYRHLIAGLADRFRCLALDYPGFGLSTASAGYDYTPAAHAGVVEAFLLALDLTGVTVMGQDWGGPIGLGVAARHPARFRALIAGNTFAWPVGDVPRLALFSRFIGGPPGGVLIRRFNAFVNVGLPLGVRRRRLAPAVMAAYRGPFARPASRAPIRVFARELLTGRDFLAAVEAGLPRLAGLPALLVWGDRDPAFRAPERRRFERAFPRHRTVILRGAGHFIQEDAPGDLVAAIGAWSGELPPSPVSPGGNRAARPG